MALKNSIQRVITAIIAIPAILAVVYYGGIYFFMLSLTIALTGFYEFYTLAKHKNSNVNFIWGFAGVLFFLINSYIPYIDNYSYFILFFILLLLFELFRNNGSAIYNTGATLLGVMYVGIFVSSLLGIREFYPAVGDLYNRGAYLIFAILASIWICDSAAYYFGTAFGKHRLFLRVSPKKSWEGAITGFVFAVAAFIAAKFLFLDFLTLQTAVVFGVITGVMGQLGDLIESLIKRDAGVKDSSNLIPGHGGILDRFDSLLYTAPVILLYLKFINR